MNDKRKIEINIVEIQPYKILIQINSKIKNIILLVFFVCKVHFYNIVSDLKNWLFFYTNDKLQSENNNKDL